MLNSTSPPSNSTIPNTQIPFSLLSAFYAFSSAANSQESTEASPKTRATNRAYNPGRPLCIEDRRRIVRLYEEGNRVSHIARLIGVTHSCVSKIMSRYRRTGSVQPRSFKAYDNETWNSREISSTSENRDVNKLPFSIERILSDESAKKRKVSTG